MTTGTTIALTIWTFVGKVMSLLFNMLSRFAVYFNMLSISHVVPSLHDKLMGKQWKQCQTLFLGAPKSRQMVTAAMKLKDAYSLEEKSNDQPR